MEWWVSIAALGVEVVPDVNWMLIVSSGRREVSIVLVKEEKSVPKGIVDVKGVLSIDSELSTRKTFLSSGTTTDSTLHPPRSVTISFSSVIFSLGALYGKFVSVPIIRCAAAR